MLERMEMGEVGESVDGAVAVVLVVVAVVVVVFVEVEDKGWAGPAFSSVSVSEPERSSSSQESATGLDFGLCSGFCGSLGESLRWVSVEAMSSSLGGLCMGAIVV